MSDVLSASQRHVNMSRIRSRDTSPERKLRSMLFRAGYRFRVCDGRLPGSPDIVLRRYRTVIFVHGCFWHRHPGCRYATTPGTNESFWKEKFARNVERDGRNVRDLLTLGWNVIIVWECCLRTDSEQCLSEVDAFLKITGEHDEPVMYEPCAQMQTEC